MYRIPLDLDVSPAVGEFTTQLHIGPYDVQFTFGPIDFYVNSAIALSRGGERIALWTAGEWPPAAFRDVMNVEVVSATVPNDREIVIALENGIAMHLYDNSDRYESMKLTIRVAGHKDEGHHVI